MSLLQFPVLEENFSPLSPSRPLPTQIHSSSFFPLRKEQDSYGYQSHLAYQDHSYPL